MSKVREFLEYYAKAAKGVPAGRKAEEALVELCDMERRLAASENRDAITREAQALIQSAAERLRKEGAASSDELRAAEARGFERAREKAEAVAERYRAERETLATNEFAAEREVKAQAALVGGWSEAERIRDDIRAMKDETP